MEAYEVQKEAWSCMQHYGQCKRHTVKERCGDCRNGRAKDTVQIVVGISVWISQPVLTVK